MRAYKCDICGKLFDDVIIPTLTECRAALTIACPSRNTYSADICPKCLSQLRNVVCDLVSEVEESNESETSSSECEDILE